MQSRILIFSVALTACHTSPGINAGAGQGNARITRGTLVTENVPNNPPDVAAKVRLYQNARSADLVAWDPAGDGLYILTRFGSTAQLHHVATPMGARRQLTFFDEPVRTAHISPTPKQPGWVIQKDVGGNEANQLFKLDPTTGQATLLTDGASRNTLAVYSNDGRQVAYASNERNGRDVDVWIVRPKTGDRRLVLEAQGSWAPLDWSPDNTSLLVSHYISITRAELFVVDIASGKKTQITPTDRPVAAGDGRFSSDGRSVFYIGDDGDEFRGLRVHNLANGDDTPLTEELNWDISNMAIAPDRSVLAAVVNAGGFSEIKLFDTTRRSFRSALEIPDGVVSSPAFSPDGRYLAFSLTNPSSPNDVLVLNITSEAITQWTASEVGGIRPEKLERFETFTYTSFDKKKIPAFIIRPQSPGPHPVVVWIHGGPEAQARPRFSALNPLFVDGLQAAVIHPNVRGSAGYGRSYTLLDNGMLREDSVKDIGALLDWIRDQPDLDAGRVAVFGGSYGGYMALASGVFFGSRLRAIVDFVGISNFVTFLENTKSYRRDLRRAEYGDERVSQMRAFLERASPLNRARDIVAPLFVIQGANDPRVPQSESEQLVREVRAQGKDVWYMLAMDEGHGFRKKANTDAMFAALYMFLQKHL